SVVALAQEALSGVGVLPPEDSPAGMPIPINPDVWEFQAPIMTMALRHHREELLGAGIGEGAGDQAPGPRERIGTVSIGIAPSRLQTDRRIAFITAMLFTI